MFLLAIFIGLFYDILIFIILFVRQKIVSIIICPNMLIFLKYSRYREFLFEPFRIFILYIIVCTLLDKLS